MTTPTPETTGAVSNQGSWMGQALHDFTEYFVKNYPGPNTVICDPTWHAPRLFRNALYHIEQAQKLGAREIDAAPPAADGDDVAGVLRKLLKERSHRTDGDLITLAKRCHHMSRGDDCLINELEKEVEALAKREVGELKDAPEWAGTLDELADAVVVANATGNEGIFLDAVSKLIAGVRACEEMGRSEPLPTPTPAVAGECKHCGKDMVVTACASCGEPGESPAVEVTDGDMFWDDADNEFCRESIGDVVNHRWENGSLQDGGTVTIQQARKLPNIKVVVTIPEGYPDGDTEISWTDDALSASRQAGG